MEKTRLNKFLRDAGLGSRRRVEEYISGGKIEVNGVIVKELSYQVDKADIVTHKGLPLTSNKTFVYYLFHKPKGFLCSHKRYKNDKLIYDLFPKTPGLFSAGRLDKETTGLLILTNDGTFANKVIHPSSNIQKEYIVTVKEAVMPLHLLSIKKGTLIENALVRPKLVEKQNAHTLKIIVTEGKKREVRILIEEAGLTLLTLHRIKIGALSLGSLPEGAFLPLSKEDHLSLFAKP